MQSWAKHSLLSKSPKLPGFTIVELLIVIVVIAILAAITIVAYTGIQDRAKASAVSSAASQAGKQTLAYAPTNNDQYPTEAQFQTASFRTDTLKLPPDTPEATYDYYASDDQTSFCLSVTNTTTSPETAYAMTQNGDTVPGRCVENLVRNPSFEVDTAFWRARAAYTTVSSHQISTPVGLRVLRVARTNAGDAYAHHTTSPAVPANAPYTMSFWLWADSSVTLSGSLTLRVYNSGVCCSNLQNISGGSATSSPTKIVLSGTTSANPTIGLQTILRPTATGGQAVYYDGFMATAGSTEYSYGDGTNENWSWTGAPHNSTSFGPAIPVN